MTTRRIIATSLGILFMVSIPLGANEKPLSRDELLLLVDVGMDSSKIIEAVESRCVGFSNLSTDDALKLSEYDPGILAAIKSCREKTGAPSTPPATASAISSDEGKEDLEDRQAGITTGTWRIRLCNHAAPTQWRQGSSSARLEPVGGWESGTIDISETTVRLHVPKRTFPKFAERNIVFDREDIVGTKVNGVRNGGCITIVQYRGPNNDVQTVSFSGTSVYTSEWLGPNVKSPCRASVALHSLLIGKSIEPPFEDKPIGPEYQEAIARGFWEDPETGLTWTVNDNGNGKGAANKSLSGAEKYCKKRSLGGNHDWRVPTIEELVSLSEPGNRKNTADEYNDDTVGAKDPIKLTRGRIWSQTISKPGGAFSRKAWIYDFRTNRREENGTIETAVMHALCVR